MQTSLAVSNIKCLTPVEVRSSSTLFLYVANVISYHVDDLFYRQGTARIESGDSKRRGVALAGTGHQAGVQLQPHLDVLPAVRHTRAPVHSIAR